MSWQLNEALSYYKNQGAPSDQNALMSLLKEIQAENGSISKADVTMISEAYSIKESLINALVTRIPSLRLDTAHTLEICSGVNCTKHAFLSSFAEKICREKNITLKSVQCMRLCGKGPNIRLDGKVYSGVNEEILEKLINEI